MSRRKILYLATVDWFFVSHRLPLAIAAQEAGFDVTVAAQDTGAADKIRGAGIRFVSLPFSRVGMNPLKEASTILAILRLIRRERPDVVHTVSLKPVLYGGIAASIARVPRVVSAITGFGHLFSVTGGKGAAIRRTILGTLRLLLRRPESVVIVQNPDHAAELVERNIARREGVALIQGAGVDPDVFRPGPQRHDPPTIVLSARMLIAKGILEFAEVARRLKAEGYPHRFVLVGPAGDDNPQALSEPELAQLCETSGVEWWGRRTDMPDVLAQAHLVALPSHSEGLPKALIEALACGKAIIATDIAGCRPLVQPNWNGWLVPPRDVDALERAIREALSDPERLEEYGRRSRQHAEAHFSLEKVVAQTLEVYGLPMGALRQTNLELPRILASTAEGNPPRAPAGEEAAAVARR